MVPTEDTRSQDEISAERRRLAHYYRSLHYPCCGCWLCVGDAQLKPPTPIITHTREEPPIMIAGSVQVTFRTSEPLSQEAGLEFWRHGSHFMAVAGRCRYQFTTAPEAESLLDGVTAVVGVIDQIVGAQKIAWDGAVIEKITAVTE
jgi:hypothetical protein